MVTVEEEADFPPSRIEIVLGMEGRLFVILPTGVRTELPFACNGPFIQDPARVTIKDPETSPTNRWLLKRAGNLAADTVLAWVNRLDLRIDERCEAYGLLPRATHEGNTLESICTASVKDAFTTAIAGKPFLLTEDESLRYSGECVAVPVPL